MRCSEGGCYKRKTLSKYSSSFRLWDKGKSQHTQYRKEKKPVEIQKTHLLNTNRLPYYFNVAYTVQHVLQDNFIYQLSYMALSSFTHILQVVICEWRNSVRCMTVGKQKEKCLTVSSVWSVLWIVIYVLFKF